MGVHTQAPVWGLAFADPRTAAAIAPTITKGTTKSAAAKIGGEAGGAVLCTLKSDPEFCSSSA